jgi:hypothetical protein
MEDHPVKLTPEKVFADVSDRMLQARNVDPEREGVTIYHDEAVVLLEVVLGKLSVEELELTIGENEATFTPLEAIGLQAIIDAKKNPPQNGSPDAA